MHRKQKLTIITLVAFLALGMFALPAVQSQGAAATAASIELSADTYVADTPVTIRVYDATAAGSSFTVYFTYDSSGTDTIEAKSEYGNITVYLGSDEDEWVFTMLFPAPTGGDYVRVHATGSATGTTTDLCSDTIYVREWADIWPGDFIIEIGIDIMIALLIVGIVVGLAVIGSKKLRGG